MEIIQRKCEKSVIKAVFVVMVQKCGRNLLRACVTDFFFAGSFLLHCPVKSFSLNFPDLFFHYFSAPLYLTIRVTCELTRVNWNLVSRSIDMGIKVTKNLSAYCSLQAC